MNHEPFAVSSEADGDACTLIVSGEVDLHASPRLLEAGEQALADGHKDLTIDCQRIRFLDSSGIRVLHVLQRKVEDRGGALRLANPPKLVAAVVTMSGLGSLLPSTD